MVSNKFLAGMLVLAMVASLGSTILILGKFNAFFTPTGLATSNNTGTTQLQVSSLTSISMVTSSINFGSGYANASANANCTMNTDDGGYETGSNACVSFTSVGENSSFQLKNDGNNGVSLNVSVDTDAATIIGGTSPLLQFKFEENESGSCTGGDAYTGSWQNITSGTHYRLCPTGNFTYTDSTDQVYLHVRVAIPTDAASAGTKTANFTFVADDTN
jgi:hypothetical protein